MSTIMDGLSTIDDLDVDGRRVLLRTDFDVPLTSASAGRPQPLPMTPASEPRFRRLRSCCGEAHGSYSSPTVGSWRVSRTTFRCDR